MMTNGTLIQGLRIKIDRSKEKQKKLQAIILITGEHIQDELAHRATLRQEIIDLQGGINKDQCMNGSCSECMDLKCVDNPKSIYIIPKK